MSNIIHIEAPLKRVIKTPAAAKASLLAWAEEYDRDKAASRKSMGALAFNAAITVIGTMALDRIVASQTGRKSKLMPWIRRITTNLPAWEVFTGMRKLFLTSR
ncbi:MAG: hypothetical protein JJU36_15930 [Phycisphaeraceae bacterium]|nr:hypothetical protein [Phycisphaeraceae bacterium]